MIDEYALIHDIFDPAAYSHPELINVCLPFLREPLMKEALVRNLADGAWQRYTGTLPFTPHRLCMELVRKLDKGNRLRSFRRCMTTDPTDIPGWCHEAAASHSAEALTAIISTHASVAGLPRLGMTNIEKVTSSPWWADRTSSRTMNRSLTDYQQALTPILRHANSVMFIDPNLDPSAMNYQSFGNILALAGGRRLPPHIEIHRSFCEGDGPRRTFPTDVEWRRRFTGLAIQAQKNGIHLEVFGWDDFHDRYLIADIIGLQVGAGFDTTTNPHATTTWARLGRQDIDRFTKHFSREARPDALRWHISW